MVCFTYQVGQVMSGGGSFLLINWKGWLVDGGHFYLSGGSKVTGVVGSTYPVGQFITGVVGSTSQVLALYTVAK